MTLGDMRFAGIPATRTMASQHACHDPADD
jgi:hypothetical protein